MSEDHPTQHSILVSRTAIALTDSEDEAEDVDALALYPDLDDLWQRTPFCMQELAQLGFKRHPRGWVSVRQAMIGVKYA